MRWEETHGTDRLIAGYSGFGLPHMPAPRQDGGAVHSIPDRSDWLCVKFPGSCHSNVSCVLGCHSTLLKEDDLSGQRSHAGCPRKLC